MNDVQTLNHVVTCMAKGHAFDQVQHAQALQALSDENAKLTVRVAELEAQLKVLKGGA